MTTPRLIAAGQQTLSLGLAALVTSTVLLSLGAQADVRHAEAIARNQQAQQAAQLCAAPVAAARS